MAAEWLAYSSPAQFDSLTVEQQQFVVQAQPKLPGLLHKCKLVDNVIFPHTYRLPARELIGIDIVFYVRETDRVAIICDIH